MNKIKPTLLVVILMVLSIFTIGIAAEAAIIQNQKSKYAQQSMFDAEITFHIFEGEGCGCVPLVGATVSAYGGEGSDTQITDENGTCVLHLVILGEYRVQIESEDYQIVLFDFNVIDDQAFSFHMQEKQESSTHASLLLHTLLSKILK